MCERRACRLPWRLPTHAPSPLDEGVLFPPQLSAGAFWRPCDEHVHALSGSSLMHSASAANTLLKRNEHALPGQTIEPLARARHVHCELLLESEQFSMSRLGLSIFSCIRLFLSDGFERGD